MIIEMYPRHDILNRKHVGQTFLCVDFSVDYIFYS